MRTSWELEPQNNGWQGHSLLEDLITYLRGRALQFFPLCARSRTFILVFSNPLQNAGLSMNQVVPQQSARTLNPCS